MASPPGAAAPLKPGPGVPDGAAFRAPQFIASLHVRFLTWDLAPGEDPFRLLQLLVAPGVFGVPWCSASMVIPRLFRVWPHCSECRGPDECAHLCKGTWWEVPACGVTGSKCTHIATYVMLDLWQITTKSGCAG